jgi:hypothetical protein
VVVVEADFVRDGEALEKEVHEKTAGKGEEISSNRGKARKGRGVAPLPGPWRSSKEEALRRVEILQSLIVLQHLHELFRLLTLRKARQAPPFFLLLRR